jgi:hypothetical protein
MDEAPMRFVDSVVKELRDGFAAIAEEWGGDVHQMAERFRREQAHHPHRIVNRRKPRTTHSPPPASDSSS